MKNNYLKIQFVLTTILLIYSCSCTYDKKDQYVNVREKEYVEHLSFFDKKFINHFPTKLEGETFSYVFDPSSTFDLVRFEAAFHYSENDFLVKKTNLALNTLKKYSVSDSCLFIVNRFKKDNVSNINLTREDKLLIDRDCYKTKLPVPNFWLSEFAVQTTACKLPTDFDIYVIDADKGKFLEEKLLTVGRYMPKEWKNGYSRGIAVSDKRKAIVYWIIIW